MIQRTESVFSTRGTHQKSFRLNVWWKKSSLYLQKIWIQISRWINIASTFSFFSNYQHFDAGIKLNNFSIKISFTSFNKLIEIFVEDIKLQLQKISLKIDTNQLKQQILDVCEH